MCSSMRDRAKSPESLMTQDVQLPDGFVPSNRDVVCGRSKRNYYHDGNKYFREVVASHVRKYISAKTKVDKGFVIISIVKAIREASPQGGFVRQDPTAKAWYLVGDNAAREKVGATLRSILKAAGGEEKLLSQLVQQDSEHHHEDISEGDSLTDWIPANIAHACLHQQQDEVAFSPLASNDLFADQSRKLEMDFSFWNSTGLEFEPEEFSWLLGTAEGETLLTSRPPKTLNDNDASNLNGKSSFDELDGDELLKAFSIEEEAKPNLASESK